MPHRARTPGRPAEERLASHALGPLFGQVTAWRGNVAVIMQERARREREEIDRLMAMPLWSRAVAYLSEGLGLGTAVHSRRSDALPGVPPRSEGSAHGAGQCSGGGASGECSGGASCSSHSAALPAQRAMPEERTAPTPFASTCR